MRNQNRRFRLKPVAAAVAAVFYMPLANAIPVIWNVGVSGIWSTGANWSPAAGPLAGDDVTINCAETLTVTYNSGSVSLASLTIGSASNTLNVSAGTLTSGVLNNAGIVNVSGGTLNFIYDYKRCFFKSFHLSFKTPRIFDIGQIQIFIHEINNFIGFK